jgi:ADP-ribose pyrophosphatase
MHQDAILDDASVLIEYPESVVVVAVESGSVLVVSQTRAGAGGTTVELPAGCLEPGEDAAAAAVRELREECSLAASRWRELGKFWAAPDYSTEWVTAFEATVLSPDPGQPEPDEDITVQRLPLDSLPDALSDAVSIAAFGLWLARTR